MSGNGRKTAPPPAVQDTPEPPSPAPTPSKDVVILGPPTADGDGVHVLRAREERLEAGELRGLEEGKSIRGEIVSLKPRRDQPRICDVTDSYVVQTRGKGPPKVSTQAYRDGWDEIFGAPEGKPRRESDLN